jgi:hypothetical protein
MLHPEGTMDQKLELRQQMQQSMDDEIASRTKTHQQKLASYRSAQRARTTLGAAPPIAPLVMLAHGDSWFDYPLDGNNVSLPHTDIIVQLGSLGNINPYILNISQWGDATTAEMSWPKQQRMITAIQDPSNWLDSGKPDAILFSGGGNDVAGDQFCIFLDYATLGAGGLDATRFQEALGMVEASYRDLFAFRDRYAPDVPIIGHDYDFPIPNGTHPVCAGPWLKPSLDFCGYNLTQGTAIVRQALVDFENLLAGLANDPANKFTLVAAQGVLAADDWANELHPFPAGFKKIAEKFVDTLRARFPGRI